MNKENWISILLDGSVPEDVIKNLINMSYELTRFFYMVWDKILPVGKKLLM